MKKLKDSTKEVVIIFLNRINSGDITLDENKGVLLNKDKELGYLAKNGYTQLSLRYKGKIKKVYLHQVFFAYYYGIEELCRYETVNHKDGIKQNNSKLNLEGMSLVENSEHQHRTGLAIDPSERKSTILNEESVRQIKKLLAQGIQQHLIAEHYNVSRSSILNIRNNNNWCHIKYDEDIEVPIIDNRKKRRSDAKLTNFEVYQIRELLGKGYYQYEVAKLFNVSRSLILQIHLNKRYSNVPTKKEGLNG